MIAHCPRCNNPLRPAAKFCPRCGQTLAAVNPPPYAPPVASGPVPTAASHAAHYAAQAVGQAAAVAAPVMQAAGKTALQNTRKGMGWLARAVTLGGRAAFTDLFTPQPVAEGALHSALAEDRVAASVEPAAFLWVFSFGLFPFIFLAGTPTGELAILIGLTLGLLLLNFAGLRRPVFSRLTWGSLTGRYANGVVALLQFQINDAQRGLRTVKLIGPRRDSVALAPGQLIRLYGVWEGQTCRAWQIDVFGVDGQPLGIVTAPRTRPLSAMLFVPLIAWFIVWLLITLIP